VVHTWKKNFSGGKTQVMASLRAPSDSDASATVRRLAGKKILREIDFAVRGARQVGEIQGGAAPTGIVALTVSVAVAMTDTVSISRCMTEIKMPGMSNPEAQEILDKRLGQLGMTIDPTAKWTIVVPARGLPSYVHRLGRSPLHQRS
jgi:hypothetical protein